MQTELDCTSQGSALASIAGAFEIGPDQLGTAIDEVDLDAECEAPGYDGDPNRALMKALVNRLGRRPLLRLDAVRWFHLTRVLPNSSFDEGILPLSASLDKVWETVLGVVGSGETRTRLEQLRLQGVPDFQYQHKVGKPHLAGPYAMLVRDSAFRSHEMGNHDYLGLPEIVEDICNGYQEKFGEDLTQEMCVALRPCIVTFRATNYRPPLLEAATRYVHAVRRGEPLSAYANHVFDGANAIVPSRSIATIEYV